MQNLVPVVHAWTRLVCADKIYCFSGIVNFATARQLDWRLKLNLLQVVTGCGINRTELAPCNHLGSLCVVGRVANWVFTPKFLMKRFATKE
jgi:hypothetical protein